MNRLRLKRSGAVLSFLVHDRIGYPIRLVLKLVAGLAHREFQLVLGATRVYSNYMPRPSANGRGVRGQRRSQAAIITTLPGFNRARS